MRMENLNDESFAFWYIHLRCYSSDVPSNGDIKSIDRYLSGGVISVKCQCLFSRVVFRMKSATEEEEREAALPTQTALLKTLLPRLRILAHIEEQSTRSLEQPLHLIEMLAKRVTKIWSEETAKRCVSVCVAFSV